MILEILILFSQGIAISFWIYLFFLYRDVIKELHKFPQINAWTTTISRLKLSSNDDWFIYNPTVGYEIGFSSYEGMSPLRPIWFSNQTASLKYQYLFNLSPWVNGMRMKSSDFLISDYRMRRPGFM